MLHEPRTDKTPFARRVSRHCWSSSLPSSISGSASGAAAGEVFKANLHDLEAIEGGLGDCGCLAARVLIDRPLTVYRGAEWRKDKRYADEV